MLFVQHQPHPSQPTTLDGSVKATRQRVIRPCSDNHLQLPREVTAESVTVGGSHVTQWLVCNHHTCLGHMHTHVSEAGLMSYSTPNTVTVHLEPILGLAHLFLTGRRPLFT